MTVDPGQQSSLKLGDIRISARLLMQINIDTADSVDS
jgi:hypothetical protein